MPKFKAIKTYEQYQLAEQVLTELYMENVRTKEIEKQIADVQEVMSRYEKKLAKPWSTRPRTQTLDQNVSRETND